MNSSSHDNSDNERIRFIQSNAQKRITNPFSFEGKIAKRISSNNCGMNGMNGMSGMLSMDGLQR